MRELVLVESHVMRTNRFIAVHESAIRKLQTHFYDYGGRGYRTPVSKCSGRPLGLCGQWLPELNLVPIQIIDPGKATVGFIHSFGVNLYSLLF